MKARTTAAAFGAAAATVVLAAGVTAAVRTRPSLPAITGPILFDTPEADAVLAALQVFPPDNAWNQDVSAAPVHRVSERIIA
jgi:hypothetical protein